MAAVIPQCHAVKPDGVRCGSPALRGRLYCYYHGPGRKTAPKKPAAVLPDLRNPQQMLAWAMLQLAQGRIDTKAAGQILYAVQQLMR